MSTIFMDGVCNNKKIFSAAHTQVLKGLAVIMLLMHHGFSVLIADTPWGSLVLTNTISLTKLCVAIFTVLSGYGMYFSFRSKAKNASCREAAIFAVSHLVKLFLIFWISAAVQITAVSLIKGNFYDIYSEHSVYYLLLDCMGVSYITGTPKFVNAWWYMTAITIYYLLFPVLFLMVHRFKKLNYLLLGTSAVGLLFLHVQNSIFVYGIFFLFGMIFAECDLFNRILNAKFQVKECWKLIVWLMIFLFLCIIRQQFLYGTGADYHLDWLLTFVLVIIVCEVSLTFSIVCISNSMPVPTMIGTVVGKLFGWLGVCSFEIYLTHSVFLKYFGKIVCVPSVWSLIFIKLLVASAIAAWLLKWIEKLLQVKRTGAICKTTTGFKISIVFLVAGLFVLPAPKVIADQGIGGWAFGKQKVVMQANNYHVMIYDKLPLFWNLAEKNYTSDDNDIVYFIDGIVYAHKPGTTMVHVSLPSGKRLSCTIIVQEE